MIMMIITPSDAGTGLQFGASMPQAVESVILRSMIEVTQCAVRPVR